VSRFAVPRVTRFPWKYLTRVSPCRQHFPDLKDVFGRGMMKRVLQADQSYPGIQEAARSGASLNMTQLALGLSTYVNGVAKVHGETSRQMFPQVPIEAITNGVHAATWTSPHFSSCFDGYIASWREDNYSLRGALGLPAEDVWSAHLIAKHELFEVVRRKPGLFLTLKLSRSGSRAAPPDTSAPTSFLPTLTGFDRLPRTQARSRLFMRGKPIPTTGEERTSFATSFRRKRRCAKRFQSFSWTTTIWTWAEKSLQAWTCGSIRPQFPLEASGTSGMKAALNGVPSLSILDGWWVEGHIEGVTGWSIGESRRVRRPLPQRTTRRRPIRFYSKMEGVILPMYYTSAAGSWE